jgi:hypothetical protein
LAFTDQRIDLFDDAVSTAVSFFGSDNRCAQTLQLAG